MNKTAKTCKTEKTLITKSHCLMMKDMILKLFVSVSLVIVKTLDCPKLQRLWV